MKKGLIHIYHGFGKGKSTACMGLAVRSIGADFRTQVYQFLKGTTSHEEAPMRKLGIETFKDKSTTKFVFQMSEEEKEVYKTHQLALFEQAVAASEHLDLLIMDELLDAIGTGVLEEAMILDFLKNKRESLEVVISGRNPSEAMVAISDYCTFFDAQKHPFDTGISARRGIEF